MAYCSYYFLLFSQRMRRLLFIFLMLYLHNMYGEAHIECFNCHTSDVVDFNTTNAPLLAEQPLLCVSCHDYSPTSGILMPGEHSVSIVPVNALPSNLPLVKGMVNCTSCHDPHALDVTKLRLPAEQLCFDCHNI